MDSRSKIGAVITASVERKLILEPKFLVRSVWDVEHWRKGQMLSHTQDHNVVTNEGLDAILDIMFHASTQLTTWYILIFKTDTTPSSATTYATPVFTEATEYDEATREEYVEAAASSQVTTNTANKAEFTISDTITVYGAALVAGGTDANTKGDAAGGGTMFCASKFAAAKSVVDDDVLRVTIAITGSDA